MLNILNLILCEQETEISGKVIQGSLYITFPNVTNKYFYLSSVKGERISEYYKQNHTFMFLRLCSYETFELSQTGILMGHWVYAKQDSDFLGDISKLKQEPFLVQIKDEGRFFSSQMIERKSSKPGVLVFSATAGQWHPNETRYYSILECFYETEYTGKKEVKKFVIPNVVDEYAEKQYIELTFSCNINEQQIADLKQRQQYQKACTRRVKQSKGCNFMIRQDTEQEKVVFDSEYIKIIDK